MASFEILWFTLAYPASLLLAVVIGYLVAERNYRRRGRQWKPSGIESALITIFGLLRLLTQARAKNEQLQVTGLLLYGEQLFLQVLEGERAVAEEHYQRITEDTRHQHVTMLIDLSIIERRFAVWFTAFQGVADEKMEVLSGYVSPELLPLGAEQRNAVEWVLARFMRELVLPPPLY